jgi:hypothetical protein
VVQAVAQIIRQPVHLQPKTRQVIQHQVLQKPFTSSKTSSTSAIVTLNPTKGSKVKGTATLTLDSKTHQLTVVVKATGFTPNSVHPEQIHNAKTGVVIYCLDNLTANKSGDAIATTVIRGVKSIPATVG